MKRKKIAYLTVYDSANIHEWSGLGYSIRTSLERQNVDLVPVGPLPEAWRKLVRLKKFGYKILGKNYLWDRDPVYLKALGRAAAQALSTVEHDIVLTPGCLPIVYAEIKRPIVIWTDATFDSLVDFYPKVSNLCRETLRDGEKAEFRGLSSARYNVFSSEWAAKSAIVHYKQPASNVSVIPFGANVEESRTRLEVESFIRSKQSGPIKLFFAGVDWVRKGGDVALKISDRLDSLGISHELHIVGCSPPHPVAKKNVILHGFLSKRVAAELLVLGGLFRSSHFFILPTQADCVPVVCAEAMSYGLPCLTTDVGGMRTLVVDGVTGYAFPIGADVQGYVDRITSLFNDPESYGKLCISAFEAFRENFNWSVAGRRMANLLESI